MRISAQAFSPLKSAGSVETVCSALSVPALSSRRYAYLVPAHGRVRVNGQHVGERDGIAITGESVISITALETAEHGVTCNAICPGYVYTPLVEAQIDGQAKAHGIPREQVIRDVLLAQQPNKRFATVEELGGLAVFLASEAAASITGVALPVDGGWTAH